MLLKLHNPVLLSEIYSVTARWATSTIKQREPVGNDISVVEAGIGHIFEIQRMCESSSTMAPRWGQMSRWGGHDLRPSLPQLESRASPATRAVLVRCWLSTGLPLVIDATV